MKRLLLIGIILMKMTISSCAGCISEPDTDPSSDQQEIPLVQDDAFIQHEPEEDEKSQEIVLIEEIMTEYDDYSFILLEKMMYATTNVNVRNLPHKEGAKIGMLSKGEQVMVLLQCHETGWYVIEYEGGFGCVSDAYLKEAAADTDEEPMEPVMPSDDPSTPSQPNEPKEEPSSPSEPSAPSEPSEPQEKPSEPNTPSEEPTEIWRDRGDLPVTMETAYGTITFENPNDWDNWVQIGSCYTWYIRKKVNQHGEFIGYYTEWTHGIFVSGSAYDGPEAYRDMAREIVESLFSEPDYDGKVNLDCVNNPYMWLYVGE